MQILPVIDLKQGQIVHARLGQRERYRPVRSALGDGSEPLRLVEGLLRVYPFPALYAADLDAIEGHGDNQAVIAELRRAFPSLRLWLDAGFSEEAASRRWLADERSELVIGSEAQRDGQLLARLLRGEQAERVVLSLDFRSERFVGPRELLDEPQRWPARVIVMTLARVGSGSGPDIGRIEEIRARAGGRRLYAAGGVRGRADLERLLAIGAAGALVASALHDGSLGREEVAAAMGG